MQTAKSQPCFGRRNTSPWTSFQPVTSSCSSCIKEKKKKKKEFKLKREKTRTRNYLVLLVVVHADVIVEGAHHDDGNHGREEEKNDERVHDRVPVNVGVRVDKESIPTGAPRNLFVLGNKRCPIRYFGVCVGGWGVQTENAPSGTRPSTCRQCRLPALSLPVQPSYR